MVSKLNSVYYSFFTLNSSTAEANRFVKLSKQRKNWGQKSLKLLFFKQLINCLSKRGGQNNIKQKLIHYCSAIGNVIQNGQLLN